MSDETDNPASDEEGTDAGEADPTSDPKRPNVYVLRSPVQFGKEETIEELTFKPSARAFKEFALPMKEDGTVLFQPYPLAIVGVKMSGYAAAGVIVDKMSVPDMMGIALRVMGFIGTVPKI